MSKQIKISLSTYTDLQDLKNEDDTFNTVIRELMRENRKLREENADLRTDKENLMELLKKFKC